MGTTRPLLSRPHHNSLGREIAWVLAFKMVALAALYFAFFGPAHRSSVTPDQIAATLGEPAQTSGEH
ncbi:MAG: cytochrome oxidase putative small subunit CydP [Stellaceae bacterium]